MTMPLTREDALDVLLGRRALEPHDLPHVPAAQRPRAARRQALSRLSEHAPLSAVETSCVIRCALTDSDPHVRAAAAHAISRAAVSEVALPVLLACLLDPAEEPRRAAKDLLARQRRSEAARLLAEHREPLRAAQRPAHVAVIDGH